MCPLSMRIIDKLLLAFVILVTNFNFAQNAVISLNKTNALKPLDEISVNVKHEGILSVLDAKGNEYFRKPIEDNISFVVGGELGNQTIVLLDKKEKILATQKIFVNCKTELNDEGGKYKELFNTLYWSMIHSYWKPEQNFGSKAISIKYKKKFYDVFVTWLRDHVHTLKGMKYFYPNLKSGIDLYADSQRDDGMIWDNINSRTKYPSYWDVRFKKGNFIKPVENNTLEFHRIPVEADVEYLFIEGLYYTWKATGDNKWMISKLDNALKALKYSTSDKLRWSEKYNLLKRGYTIDTWDFQSNYDVKITGDPMVIDKEKTKFGIMFGDNTGLAASCEYLAEMLEFAGRSKKAKKIKKFALEIRNRINSLAWNGSFYLHHIPEDTTFNRDFGVDVNRQISLSNAYSINRNISHKKAVAIIKSYQKIRDEMPKSSPGEWYTIFPPFKKGFEGHPVWEYMNGGVTPIVAGELAHGAFEHGFEKYGVDILNRVNELTKENNNFLFATYLGKIADKPKRKFIKVDIKKNVNVNFSGEKTTNVPGWSGEGDNDLHEMPTGNIVLQNIPFTVIDPNKNNMKACLGLSEVKGYNKEASIKIGKKAKSIYLLHVYARKSPGKIYAGSLKIIYDDDTEYVDNITDDKIGNWWFPKDPVGPLFKMPKCKVAWRGKNKHCPNIGVFVYGLNNPFPEKKIKSLHMESAHNKNKWFVLGITLSDTPVFFEKGKISSGIPDNWAAASVMNALVEGLAGVKDEGIAFSKTSISPRWNVANVNRSEVTIKYEASGGYVKYRYLYDKDKNILKLKLTSSSKDTNVNLLIPEHKQIIALNINGNKSKYFIKSIEKTNYASFNISGIGIYDVTLYFSGK